MTGDALFIWLLSRTPGGRVGLVCGFLIGLEHMAWVAWATLLPPSCTWLRGTPWLVHTPWLPTIKEMESETLLLPACPWSLPCD